ARCGRSARRPPCCGRRRPPTCRRTSGRAGSPRRARYRGDGDPRVPIGGGALLDSPPVAKQPKRERQRLNREARRQAELAAARRRKQWRTGRTIAIFAVPLGIVFVVLQLRSSGGSEPNRKFSKP